MPLLSGNDGRGLNFWITSNIQKSGNGSHIKNLRAMLVSRKIWGVRA